jgi:hypothetical protein
MGSRLPHPHKTAIIRLVTLQKLNGLRCLQLSRLLFHPTTSTVQIVVSGQCDSCTIEGKGEGPAVLLSKHEGQRRTRHSRNCLTVFVVYLDVTPNLS